MFVFPRWSKRARAARTAIPHRRREEPSVSRQVLSAALECGPIVGMVCARSRQLTSVACLALGCSLCDCAGAEEPELTLAVPPHLALGSEVAVAISASCRGRCEDEGSRSVVDSASVSDPSVIEIRQSGPSFLLKTLREGAVDLRVRGRSADGSVRKDFTATVHVIRPDRITIEPPSECSLPIVVGAGSRFSIRATLWRGTDRLWGDPRPFPLTSDVVGWDPNSATFGRLEITAGDARGTGAIRSAVSDEALPVEVSDADQVAAVRLEGPASAPVIAKGARFSFRTTVNVGGRTPCHEAFLRQVTVETPGVCAVDDLVDAGKKVTIEAAKAGTCVVAVSVGTGARETMTIEVRER
jgi:hypothetical protein